MARDDVRFAELAECLKIGREIEFSYGGKDYSITNSPTGYWYFCRGDVVLERVCPFRELDYLASRMADVTIDGVTVRRIFDDLLYDETKLWIL